VQDVVFEEYWRVWNYNTEVKSVNLTSMTIYISRLPNITTTYTVNNTYPVNATQTFTNDVGYNPLALERNWFPGPKETAHINEGTDPITTAGVKLIGF
jgi:hypothetical protein